MQLLCSLCEPQPPRPSSPGAQLSFSMLPPLPLLGLPQSSLTPWLQPLAGLGPRAVSATASPSPAPGDHGDPIRPSHSTHLWLQNKSHLFLGRELFQSCQRGETALGRGKKFPKSPSRSIFKGPWRSPSSLPHRRWELFLTSILQKPRLNAAQGHRASKGWSQNWNPGLLVRRWRTIKPPTQSSIASSLLG